jgi:acyl carrier protein
MTAKLNAEMILKYLADDLAVDDALDAKTKLFSSSILDSFQMMSLVEFVEKRCGFKVGPDDVTLENFDTIERILRYSAERLPA